MKLPLAVILSSAVCAQAVMVQFDLSPAGTDAAVGLSPANEAPPAANSTGSGNEISGGIVFDTDTSILQMAIGYGSSAGFTDLTGAATLMHIHGPAPVGVSTGAVVNLMNYHFPAADPAKGGTIVGSIPFPTNAVADLLAGLMYVNIHTVANPAGEIRGQLIPLQVTNNPPTLSCPGETTAECGVPITVTALASDAEGDALSAVWSLNGTPIQTNSVAAGTPGASVNLPFTVTLSVGTNVVGITVTDSATNSASCSTTVIVVDTLPPVFEKAAANPNVLWPPNHKMVSVSIRARVTDICGPATWKILSVESNEDSNGLGDGNTSPDWEITGDHTLKLRAERSGKGHGRMYHITLQAEDAAGNTAQKTVHVIVPKSKGRNEYYSSLEPNNPRVTGSNKQDPRNSAKPNARSNSKNR